LEPKGEFPIATPPSALDIAQPVAGLAKRHAEPRRYGRDPATAVAAPEQKILPWHSAYCEEAASLVVIITGEPAYLALDAPHVLADLVIVANLAATDESAVVVPEPVVIEANNFVETMEVRIEPVVAISDAPGPADVGANVDAGPVVHDWSCYRWRLHRHVRCLRSTPQHQSGDHAHSQQQQPSHKCPLWVVQPTL